MQQFAGAYQHTDILIFTSLSDVIELSLRDLARDLAKSMDTYIRNQLSGQGAYVYGGTATTSLTIGNGAILTPKDIVEGVVTLDSKDNARPPDNHYPCIIHPKTVYDLQTNLSAGAWLN